MRAGADRVSLVSGLAIIAVGIVLLLDRTGDLAPSAGVLGAILAAAAGVILIVSGLEDGDE